tara:strand:+ start:146 stop:583 length:438 start_codon:yes stop_codon:yes gene_type:complete
MEIVEKNINNYDEECSVASNILEILNKIEISFNEDSRRFRKIFKNYLIENNYSVDVRLDTKHNITITSILDNTAVCLQLGNVARYGYDFIKLQYLSLLKKNFKVIYICPLYSEGNKASFKRVSGELEDLYLGFISFPLKIIGIDN